jgi:hypothetical protein
MKNLKKAFPNRSVTYMGQTDENYTNGETYTIEIAPFSDDHFGGNTVADNRYMVYKSVTNLFREGNNPSGYRVYSDLKSVAKDFKKNG